MRERAGTSLERLAVREVVVDREPAYAHTAVPYTPEQKAAAERNQDRVNAAAIAAGVAGSTLALVPVAGPFVAAGCGCLLEHWASAGFSREGLSAIHPAWTSTLRRRLARSA